MGIYPHIEVFALFDFYRYRPPIDERHLMECRFCTFRQSEDDSRHSEDDSHQSVGWYLVGSNVPIYGEGVILSRVLCSDCVETSILSASMYCEGCLDRWAEHGHKPGLYESGWGEFGFENSKNPLESDATHYDGPIALRDFFA